MFIQHWVFFHHKMNIFDLFIVFVDMLGAILSNAFPQLNDMGPISLLRALRTLRMVRVMRNFVFFRDLYLMMKGMVGALRPILFAFVLILAALTIFSIMAVDYINPVVKKMVEKGYDYPRSFSSVWDANLTFFSSIIAGDSWGTISLPIIREAPVVAVPIIFGAFCSLELGLLNVVVAVVVD